MNFQDIVINTFKVNVQIELKLVRDLPFSDAVDTAEHDQGTSEKERI